MTQSELMLMQTLILEKHQRKVFENILTTALELIIKEGEVRIDGGCFVEE